MFVFIFALFCFVLRISFLSYLCFPDLFVFSIFFSLLTIPLLFSFSFLIFMCPFQTLSFLSSWSTNVFSWWFFLPFLSYPILSYQSVFFPYFYIFVFSFFLSTNSVYSVFFCIFPSFLCLFFLSFCPFCNISFLLLIYSSPDYCLVLSWFLFNC